MPAPPPGIDPPPGIAGAADGDEPPVGAADVSALLVAASSLPPQPIMVATKDTTTPENTIRRIRRN